MTFRIRFQGILGLLLAWGLLLAVSSCNVTTEDGHTFMNVARDSAWDAFDSLEISWVDSSGGKSGILFSANPNQLGDLNAFRADGYQGQRITLEYKGFKADSLISQVRQTFDPIAPKVLKLDTVISPNTGKENPSLHKGPLPRVTLLDTFTISIRDSVTFKAQATVDSGTLAAYAFDYDGDGKNEDSLSLSGTSASFKGGHRFPLPATYTTRLRVHSARGAMTEVTGQVIVLKDEPTADPGPEQTVFTGDTVHLAGIGRDSLGKIAHMEWKVGTGAFVKTTGTHEFKAPTDPGDVTATFRVTDDDSQTVIASVTIHVLSRTLPTLTGLSVSMGKLSPAFNPSDTAYVDTVPFSVGSISVVPSGNGTLSVEGKPVTSGQSSAGLTLTVGENDIAILVHLTDGSDKTYHLLVRRLPASTNVALSGLTISSGILEPAFASGKTAYSAQVENSVTDVDLTVTLDDTTSALTVNGVPTKSGMAASVALKVGVNPVSLVVVSQSGASKIYTISMTRPQSEVTTLSSLVVSEGTLDPVFDSTLSSYAVTVGNATVSIVITPKAASGAAKVIFGEDTLAGGKPTPPIPLTVGLNTITITVAAENGATRNYTLEVTRAMNGNADLDSLETSLGSVSPDFTKTNKAYFLNAGYHTHAFTVRAKAHATTTTLTVNDAPLASGVSSDSIPLTEAVTLVNILATAEDGSSQTYVLTVTRDTVSRELMTDFDKRSFKTDFGTYWNYYDDRPNGGNSIITSGDTSTSVTIINKDSWDTGNAGSNGALKLGFRFGDIPPSCGTGCTYGNYIAAQALIHTLGSTSADMTGATSISFYAKGDTAITLYFVVETSDITDFAYYRAIVPITTEWAMYTVQLMEGTDAGFLAQPNWGDAKPFNIKKVSGMDIEIRREENPVLNQGEVLIDDIYINDWRK